MAVPDRDELHAELELVSRVETALREGLYSVRAGAWRANAVSALADAAAERVLIVGCDFPLVPQALLELLFEKAEGVEAVVPVQADGRVQPLCAVYARSVRAAVERALAEGRRKASAPLDDLNTLYVQPAEYAQADPGGDAFRNVNTPEELREALERIS